MNQIGKSGVRAAGVENFGKMGYFKIDPSKGKQHLLKGRSAMKTRWTLLTVILLCLAVGGSPALAGVYGHRHYRHPHFPRHHHYGHHHYYHPHGGEIFFGALLGFTLGALLTPPPPVYTYRDYPPPVVYREYVYVPAPTRIHREPVYSQDAAALDPTCLQTREYTTAITIEGREVQAYGTKCLRPDGSWSYGPARPVPSF